MAGTTTRIRQTFEVTVLPVRKRARPTPSDPCISIGRGVGVTGRVTVLRPGGSQMTPTTLISDAKAKEGNILEGGLWIDPDSRLPTIRCRLMFNIDAVRNGRASGEPLTAWIRVKTLSPTGEITGSVSLVTNVVGKTNTSAPQTPPRPLKAAPKRIRASMEGGGKGRRRLLFMDADHQLPLGYA